jgi:DNA-binding LacI/PurR family transcriptional regulator
MGGTETSGKANGTQIEGTAALARHLGLSRWTVSRILNGHSGVKEETRQRVMKAVAELGFEPNKLARSLRGGRSGLIGVSFPYLEATVLAEKSRVLKNELAGDGYRGIFEISEGDPAAEADVIRHFLSISVDGVVLIASKLEPDDPIFEEVQKRGAGIVVVDSTNDLPVMRVQLDRQKAMAMVLEHLREMGHRRIALLGLGSDDMYRKDRTTGLKRACKALGLDFEKDLMFIDAEGFSWRDYSFGAELGKKVLALRKNQPTALVCLNDCLAVGAMRVLQEGGKSIPGDYSVVGFDNTPESQWGFPSLTSVDQNISSLMKNARELLSASIEGSDRRMRKVSPELVARGSTGPVVGQE